MGQNKKQAPLNEGYTMLIILLTFLWGEIIENEKSFRKSEKNPNLSFNMGNVLFPKTTVKDR